MDLVAAICEIVYLLGLHDLTNKYHTVYNNSFFFH
jgi:hypothetical protein